MNLSRFLYLRMQGARIDSPVFRGGGDAPQSTTSVNQLYSPEESARRAKVMSEAEKVYNANKGSFTSMLYPGAKPMGLDLARAFAQGPGATMATNVGNATNFGLSGDVLKPESNPALQGTIEAATRPITQAYTDPGGVLSQIRSHFSNANSGGTSTREGVAGGIAGRGYLNAIGDVSSKIAYDSYGKGLDFMKSSMAFAPSAYQTMMNPTATLMGAGQAQEDYAAAGRSWEMNAPWLGLQNYANIVFGGANPSTQTTSTGSPVNSGPMQALGGAAAGAAIGSMVPGIGTAIGAAAGLMMGLL